MTILCNSALALNTQAVSHLLEGQYKHASMALRSALSKIEKSGKATSSRTGCDSDPMNTDSAQPLVGSSSTERQQETMMLCSVPLPDLPSTASSTFCDHVFDFYNRAFLVCNCSDVVLSPPPAGNDNDQHCHTLSAILLFNLGLTSHHLAIRSGDSKVLKRALQLYQYSFAILESASETLLSSADVTILSALTNNMLHICSTLFDRDQANQALEMLRRLMTCVESHPQFMFMKQDEYIFFAANLLFVSSDSQQQQILSLAPAA